MLCRICVVQIQPRKHALGMQIMRIPPDNVSWIIQIIQIIQIKNISALKDLDHER